VNVNGLGVNVKGLATAIARLRLRRRWRRHLPPSTVATLPRRVLDVAMGWAVGGALSWPIAPAVARAVAPSVDGALSWPIAPIVASIVAVVSPDVAPAVATLGRPFRWLRIPVDDWAVTLGLSLRAFPMLLDEFRLLYAARRLRPRAVLPDGRVQRRRWLTDMVDLLAAGVTVALRRADEMGDAITARGGTGQIAAAPSRPRRADWVALAICAGLCLLAIWLDLKGYGRG
jgi:energy-coupling factor transport system permease protein